MWFNLRNICQIRIDWSFDKTHFTCNLLDIGVFNASRNNVSRISVKTMQVYPRNKWRSAEFSNSTTSSIASIYWGLKAVLARGSTASSIDTLFLEVYEIQFFRADFNPTRVYMFRLSFLTTLNIYKDYFKGRQRLRKCEAKFCSCKLWLETEFALVHLSLEEAVVFVHRRVL